VSQHAQEDRHPDDDDRFVSARPQLLQGKQREHQRREPTWTEPADEEHRVPAKTRTERGQRRLFRLSDCFCSTLTSGHLRDASTLDGNSMITVSDRHRGCLILRG
jgi:hypothetical protein